MIDLGAAPLDGEADWYTLTSHEESLQILVSRPCFFRILCTTTSIQLSRRNNKIKNFHPFCPRHETTNGVKPPGLGIKLHLENIYFCLCDDDDVCFFCCCCYFSIRRGGRDCRCPSRPRLQWALWTICRRLQPRLASPIRSQTHRIWATGRKAVVAAAAALGAVAAVAHFYHPLVIPEELSSAVSAVTGPQSAAWAAVPGILCRVCCVYVYS